MEQNGTIGALALFGQNDCTPQSVVKALDNFLRAVQQMREVVMVPSRLKDMTVCPVKEISNKNSKALMPSWSTNSLGSDEIMPKMDLFSFYGMLASIRNELVCGSGSSTSSLFDHEMISVDENENHVEEDEHAKRLAHAFRQHMQGLFTILGQFTDAANYLSKKYQDEFVGVKK